MAVEVPSGATSVTTAPREVSAAIELVYRCRFIGPDSVYGLVIGGGVNVRDWISFWPLVFSHCVVGELDPASAVRPALHCTVLREQALLAGIHGSLRLDPGAGGAAASEPSFSEWAPEPDASGDRYQFS